MTQYKGFRKTQNSLAFQVGFGFSLIGIVLLGALLITLWVIANVDQRTRNLLAIQAPIAELEGSLISAIQQTVSTEIEWLTEQTPALQAQRTAIWNNTITAAQNELESRISHWQQTDVVDSLHQINSTLDALKTYQDKFEQTYTGDKTTAAITLLKQTEVYTESIRKQFVQISAIQNMLYTAELTAVQTKISNLFYTDWSFLILGTLLCAILGLILTRSITQPIYRLVEIARSLAKGNLDQTINITATREFEELSRALNEMVQTFQNLASVTEAMATGDYSHRVQVKSDEDRLSITVNQMLENFNLIVSQANTIAKGDYSLDITPRSAKDTLGTSLRNMTQILQENKLRNIQENWLKDGVAELANTISGIHDITKLCHIAISTIARYLSCGVGVIYIYENDDQQLILTGTYAFIERESLANHFALGEGIVGQVAKEMKPIMLKKVERNECVIESGTSTQVPHHLYAFPLCYETALLGVVELGALQSWTSEQFRYIEQITPMLATQIRAAEQQTLTNRLLQESKRLANKLQSQQAELKSANEELKIKDEQQQAINKKLEERTQELEQQKNEIEEKTEVIRKSSEELKIKASELEKASAYKSEFLANMSHELRTPLNSLLILAKLFVENKYGNLLDEQVESAKIMLQSGQDLLTLINDILDLAKVEAGKLELHTAPVLLASFIARVKRDFTHVTEKRGIQLITELEDNLPDSINTDEQRLNQIIRNLLSNAIKFTDIGAVSFKISINKTNKVLPKTGLNISQCIAFSVTDTGIGIPKEKQQLIFDSFQQADGSTSRKYGGTGLGLSISTELSKLLGGEIDLVSEVGKGSTFTLYLPATTLISNEVTLPATTVINSPMPQSTLPQVTEGKNSSLSFESLRGKKILLVDDDMRNTFALSRVLKDRGLEILIAANGKMAIETLNAHPDMNLVLMDVMMPVMDGYTATQLIRQDARFSTLPIIILTAKAMKEEHDKCIAAGGTDFLTKPIDTDILLAKIDKYLQAAQS